MSFRKKKGPIPDPGQRVRLVGHRGRWRGRYRTISGPLTDPRGEVVIWVAEEREYGEASREGRRAIGMPWPARQMELFSSSEVPESASEAPEGAEPRSGTVGPQTSAQESEGTEEPPPETARRPWWLRWLGG